MLAPTSFAQHRGIRPCFAIKLWPSAAKFAEIDFAYKSLKTKSSCESRPAEARQNSILRHMRTFMIIVCPDCQTRYKTTAKAIGPNGRTVRCANCSSSWFVAAEADELTLDRLALEDIEASQNEVFQQERQNKAKLKDSLIEQSKRQSAMGSGRQVDNAALAAAAWTGEADEAPSLRGAHEEMRERTERRRARRRFLNVMLIWLVPLVLLAAMAATAYHYRQDIVDREPRAASLYKALGIEVSASGMTLTPPITRYAQIDGKPVLIVEGKVNNISNESVSLPLVALSLYNSSGQELAQWNVQLETDTLEAGDSAPYLSQYPSPPLDAVEMRSRLATETQIMTTPVEIFAPEPN